MSGLEIDFTAVVGQGHIVHYGSQAARAPRQSAEILAVLIRAGGKLASHDALALGLWGKNPDNWPDLWMRVISRSVSAIRKIIGPWGFQIDSHYGDGYALRCVGAPSAVTTAGLWARHWRGKELSILCNAVVAKQSWQDIQKALPDRSMYAIRRKAWRLFPTNKPSLRRWTVDETEALHRACRLPDPLTAARPVLPGRSKRAIQEKIQDLRCKNRGANALAP